MNMEGQYRDMTVTANVHVDGVAPWLAVGDADRAVEYYKTAFGAVETYRLAGPDGRIAVAQLQLGGAALWVQDDPDASALPRAARPIRLILTVDDPDALFERAIAAGATQVAPVHEEHGWRTGRVADPFGHDWEFSRRSG